MDPVLITRDPVLTRVQAVLAPTPDLVLTRDPVLIRALALTLAPAPIRALAPVLTLALTVAAVRISQSARRWATTLKVAVAALRAS